MSRDGQKWQTVTALAAAACLLSASAAYSQFTSFNDRSRSVLEGNWQSCRESDGQYSERIYDARLPGLGAYELHMGPYHEFALFRGVQEEHRDHTAAENLLKPYSVGVDAGNGQQSWTVSGLSLTVTLAGGSREECESWFVILKRLDSSSSH